MGGANYFINPNRLAVVKESKAIPLQLQISQYHHALCSFISYNRRVMTAAILRALLELVKMWESKIEISWLTALNANFLVITIDFIVTEAIITKYLSRKMIKLQV